LVWNRIILFSTSNSADYWDLPPNPPRGLLTYQKSKVPPTWGRACPSSAGDLGRGKSRKGVKKRVKK